MGEVNFEHKAAKVVFAIAQNFRYRWTMKIYTKKGDDGSTGLLGGTRLPKHHLRIESYGTLDELNSFIGALRDHQLNDTVKNELLHIQEDLFTLGSHLAADPEKNKMELPEISKDRIFTLEKHMDDMDAVLPEMKFFVLPGGHPAVSACHICRCVCRRAERLCVELSEHSEVPEILLSYLNRLSDYFFVLARQLTKDFKVEEIPWNPKSR
ncbi:MAG: cob(I)yrinic acid a,c-diamide adenosyltransferase [Salibacteraceae bacterium]